MGSPNLFSRPPRLCVSSRNCGFGGRLPTSIMTDRTLHLPVAAQPRVETLLEYAVVGEDRGYGRVWLPETWGRDAVSAVSYTHLTLPTIYSV